MPKQDKLLTKIALIFILFLSTASVLKANSFALASDIGCCQKFSTEGSVDQCWNTKPENCSSAIPELGWVFKTDACNTLNECSTHIQPPVEAKCKDVDGCIDLNATPERSLNPFNTAQTQSELAADVNKKPLLEINIPGLNFSNTVSNTDETGTYLYIPWVAELISALYKFGIAVVSIVAAAVIVIQGLRVVTSAGGQAQTDAYKKIFQSIIGLVIAWGSFAILYNVNPNLVQFNALRVKVIQRVELAAALNMQTTVGDTTVINGSGTTVGSYTSQFSNCPITLDNPLNNDKLSPRTKEFFDKIVGSPVITGSTPAARTLQIADAAISCGVAMGSCGRTAGEIYNLAGVKTKVYPDASCLLTGHGCEPQGDLETHSLPREIILDPLVTHADGTVIPITDVQKLIFNKNISGWPDSWANDLQPGDAIWVYNGNSFGGNHTAIFTGWGSGGNAQVIQGSYGRPTFSGALCIKSECGDKMLPIIKTFRPN